MLGNVSTMLLFNLLCTLLLQFLCETSCLISQEPTATPRSGSSLQLPSAQPTFLFPTVEYNALYDLYNSTDGVNWNWKNVEAFGKEWRFEGSGVNPCAQEWQGLTCTVVNNKDVISGITLVDFRMAGRLPPSIANFTSLTFLNLSLNALFGTIPPELGQLRKLQVLQLDFNGLDGTIPVEITNCSKLTVWQLNHNYLVGTIPKEIGQMPHLQQLNFEENDLFGTIPVELGSLRNIQLLELNQNELTGPVPESFCDLETLTTLELTNNNLNGTIPRKMYQLTQLQVLVLNNNLLSGSIPATLGQLRAVRNLNLGTNRLTGTIPEELGNLTTLRYLDLSLNRNLSGTLPAVLSQLSELNTLYVESNYLSGPIPREFGQLTKLVNLELSGNFLTGTIPLELSAMVDMTDLLLGNNQLTGTIPEVLCTLTKLNKLSLASNWFNGSIPLLLSNITSLSELDLSGNALTGSIPPELSLLSRLTTLSLALNYLTGTLPSELCALGRLTTLEVNNNHIHGSIPKDIKNMTLLQTLSVYVNEMTGSLPEELSALKTLTTLQLANNQFSRSLPSWLGQFPVLQTLLFNTNAFTGSIPTAVYNLTLLNVFVLFDNFLTGTVPYQLTRKPNKVLQYLAIDYNLLSGTVPSDLFNLQALTTYDVKSNLFTGTIPPSIGDTEFLQYLDVSYNALTGTLPNELQKLRFIEALFLQENSFTGDLLHFVNSTNQRRYTNIDASSNYFGGAIPTEMFKIKTFQTFAAVSNCLTGSLPDSICGAGALTSLALDGISTASVCRHRYTKVHDTYGLKYHLAGGIPSCLFNMSSLQTLHLSGNGIEGQLSDHLVIGEQLVDLSLSYNVLSGTIPLAIQQHTWENLDLSYNKFTGELSSSAADPGSGQYLLKVNRLSGIVPQSLLNATDISILSGNIFTCQYSGEATELPSHDAGLKSYSCGSNTANVSLFVWCGVTAAAVLCGLVCLAALREDHPIIRWIRGAVQRLRTWLAVFDAPKKDKDISNIHILGIFMADLRRVFVVFGLFMILIASPSYVGLSFSFNTYYHEYAWSLAATYLSGVTPAVLIFLVCAIILTFVIYQSIVSVKFNLVDFYRRPTLAPTTQWFYVPLAFRTLVAVVNIAATVSVNIGFVLITVHYGSRIVIASQLCLAVYKVAWNELVLRGLIYAGKYFNAKNGDPNKVDSILLPVCLLLFNGILCPCLATLLLNPDCFASIVVPPSTVTASYDYQVCDDIRTNERSLCTSYATVTASTSYLPPFNYSYQCSSALVSTYASVYVFIFLIKTFALPLMLMLLKGIDQCLNKAGAGEASSCLGNCFSTILPDFLKSIEQLEKMKTIRILFFKEIFTIRSIYICGILLTFGVMFPPIALVAAVNILSQTYCAQLILGRLIVAADDKGLGRKYRAIIERDCHETTNLFWSSLYPLIPLVSVFYSFFVYDTYGDEVGWRNALWLVLLTMLMPLVIMAAFYLYQWRFPVVRKVVKRRKTGKARSDTLRGGDSSLARLSVFKLSVFFKSAEDVAENDEEEERDGSRVTTIEMGRIGRRREEEGKGPGEGEEDGVGPAAEVAVPVEKTVVIEEVQANPLNAV